MPDLESRRQLIRLVMNCAHLAVRQLVVLVKFRRLRAVGCEAGCETADARLQAKRRRFEKNLALVRHAVCERAFGEREVDDQVSIRTANLLRRQGRANTEQGRNYSGAAYGAIVYGRGPIFVDELAAQMGLEAFDQFLKDYYATYQWGIATTEGYKQLAEKHCDCDLTDLFNEWVFNKN